MIRGVLRLFTVLALLWGAIGTTTWLALPKSPYAAQELATIWVEVVVVYALGWVIAFAIDGFAKIPRY